MIRPLAYCRESDIADYAHAMQFPIIPCNLCGTQENLQRQEIKGMLTDWERQYPGEQRPSSERWVMSHPRICWIRTCLIFRVSRLKWMTVGSARYPRCEPLMLLEATQVAIERGDRRLLSGVDLSVAGGEIWQLVGANGVGKTSLLRGLAGVARLGVTGEIRHGSTFLYLGHASALKLGLSAVDNLRWHPPAMSLPPRARFASRWRR